MSFEESRLNELITPSYSPSYGDLSDEAKKSVIALRVAQVALVAFAGLAILAVFLLAPELVPILVPIIFAATVTGVGLLEAKINRVYKEATGSSHSIKDKEITEVEVKLIEFVTDFNQKGYQVKTIVDYLGYLAHPAKRGGCKEECTVHKENGKYDTLSQVEICTKAARTALHNEYPQDSKAPATEEEISEAVQSLIYSDPDHSCLNREVDLTEVFMANHEIIKS